MNKSGPRPIDPEVRFWGKVDKTQDCWIWTAGTRRGYGHFWSSGKDISAHRFSYELLVGKIPDGLQLDHLCRNRVCVNPDHLEPVTLQENLRRGNGNKKATKAAAQKRRMQTECKRNHPYNEENTYKRPDGGRDCRECMRLRKTGGLK